MSVIFGLVFLPLFIGWIIYRVFITKDIKEHKHDLYGLTFFMIAWAAIYYFIFH